MRETQREKTRQPRVRGRQTREKRKVRNLAHVGITCDPSFPPPNRLTINPTRSHKKIQICPRWLWQIKVTHRFRNTHILSDYEQMWHYWYYSLYEAAGFWNMQSLVYCIYTVTHPAAFYTPFVYFCTTYSAVVYTLSVWSSFPLKPLKQLIGINMQRTTSAAYCHKSSGRIGCVYVWVYENTWVESKLALWCGPWRRQ